ncbi:MAG: hypothetical protein BWY89_00171 [Bacteroidetes bacterium ADurb.BinA012]|nr:MAG: hypothetical protein BWY89_00171 [Bacteroidetes bacterium ADurb.BinA012]
MLSVLINSSLPPDVSIPKATGSIMLPSSLREKTSGLDVAMSLPEGE